MHRITFLALLLLGVLGAHAQESYFPKGAFSDDTRSDLFKAKWYSTHLKALNEPSLLRLASKPSCESYRFVWLRTFHHPVIVRLDITADGIGLLTTKVSNGAGGYKPGQLIENLSRSLTREQTNMFLASIGKNKFWELPNYENSGEEGADGSQWIIEGVKGGKYHIVDRWTPNAGPVRELGLTMALGLAELKIPKNALY
jgi:hypothetical protein